MSRVVNFTLSEETTTNLTATFYAGEDGVMHCQLMPVENITGWLLQCTARAQLNVLPLLFQKQVGSGITITDGPNGKFDIAMNAADTMSATPQNYFFDIQRIDAGFHSELGIGTLTVAAPVAAF